MARVIVTGSREWDDYAAIEDALASLPKDSVIMEGGARGADGHARFAAKVLGLRVETYPADWDIYGRAAGSIRNQKMLDAGADLVLAFPLPGSRGTWDMVRRAERAGIEVRVWPAI